MGPAVAGDPMSDVKWCRRSTRRIAVALRRRRVRVSHSTVWRQLRKAKYSLRSNRKRLSIASSPDRDRQFKRIELLRRDFRRTGDPILSGDTKKRELVGLFKNPGRVWAKAPTDVNTYDFPKSADGVAIPYGLYDPVRDEGFVLVGTSRNTPEFAAEAIWQWWKACGQRTYRRAKRLLLLLDSGGSNGVDQHVFKRALLRLAAKLRLKIVVAHFPPGASKWNPVEHRMFARISINWAGQPLVDLATVREFIRNTRLASGKRIRVRVDRRRWLTTKERKKLGIEDAPAPGCVRFARVMPVWNYTLLPPTRTLRRAKYSS